MNTSQWILENNEAPDNDIAKTFFCSRKVIAGNRYEFLFWDLK